MEPVTATAAVKAGLTLYEAGGLALLLLALGVVGGSLMVKFLMGLIQDLGARLNAVQDQQTGLLVGVIKESTDASREMRNELARQTAIIVQQNEALRQRKCLVETDTYHKPQPTPLPRIAGA
jgi:uncharacterized protein HemX